MKVSQNFFRVFTSILFFCVCLQAEDNGKLWKLGLGVGPNLTKLDVVDDDLGSSLGAAVWLSRSLKENQRLDLTLDYFTFSGSNVDYIAFSGAYGLEFFKNMPYKSFGLIGLGMGQANNFPRAVNSHQTPLHFFARAGMDEIFKTEKLSVGLIFDFMHVDLDDKPATQAQLGLPMVSLVYQFDQAAKASQPMKVIQPPLQAEKIDVDSDGDGVLDKKDECPNTAAGLKVNKIGCPLKEKVKKALRVEFATAKADIKSDYLIVLDEFAEFLKDNGDLQVVIEGHTDSVGSRKYNLDLSRRRAEAVKKYLVEKRGIAATRLKSAGFGPDRPEVSNDSVEGRSQNRRVLAVFSSEN